MSMSASQRTAIVTPTPAIPGSRTSARSPVATKRTVALPLVRVRARWDADAVARWDQAVVELGIRQEVP